MIELPIVIAIAVGSLLGGYFYGNKESQTEKHKTDKYIECVRNADSVRECGGLE